MDLKNNRGLKGDKVEYRGFKGDLNNQMGII